MNNQKEVTLGVLGCGGHAIAHMESASTIRALRLVAACDTSFEAVQNFCNLFHHAKIKELCLEPADFFAKEFDAVLIASSDQWHIDHLTQALAAGKHVFIEKPLALNLPDLEKLIVLLDIAEGKNLVVTSCHPRRTDPPFTWLKSELPKLIAELGRILRFEFDFSYHRPTKDWKITGRSLMLDHLSHELDLLHFLTKKCEFRASVHFDSPDEYLVTGRRTDGIFFQFHGTRFLENKTWPEKLHIRFQRGELTLDSHAGIATIHYHESSKNRVEKCGKTDYDLRLQLIMSNFVNSILGKEKGILTREDLVVNNELGVRLNEEGSFTMHF